MPYFLKKRGSVLLFRKIAILLIFLCGITDKIFAEGTYPKIEASFNITSLATDPFDYTVTDVRVRILQPDGSIILLPAFFDGGTTWRVRHTPTMAGTYSISGITLNGGTISVTGLTPSSWTVTGFPTSAGYVRVDTNNPRRFITSNGRRFFPVGENMAWSSPSANALNIFPKMGAAHENWSRVWMTHFYEGSGLGLNLDWPKVNNTFGQLSLPNAQNWDAIVAAADQAGIHFQMTLQHHGQYSTTVDPNWSDNPYNTANGGFLSDPTNFFTDATAKALTKRKLRYAVARWGYSPAIMGWELFNEVENTDAARDGEWDIIQAWHDEMATFIRSQDPYHHLITTSSVLNEPIWDKTDYYTHHDYPSDLISGIRDAQDISDSQPVAPDYSSECGINFTPHVGISPPIWAGLMAGQSGDAMPWYWDTIDPNNDYFLIQAAADFVTVSGLADQDELTKSSPPITGGANGPLMFALGGGFNAASQDTFTVGDGAPDGVGTAPPFLQGDYHRSYTPNGYTFNVNYTQAGTFSVQIIEIALSGAGFEMFLDDNVVTNLTFPVTANDTATNLTIRISVPAGTHSVQLYNPSSQDWVELGNITLNPYVPVLSAYAIGNTNFNATWIWNRNNIFATNASGAVAGTVQVAGLNPGTYSGTWWDTFGAGVINNFIFTVTDANVPVTLATPPILRSVALYVGIPAHAAITASNLTQSAALNSPPFILPLTITNSGGLPLAYSISVTGSNHAWLSLSSTNDYVSKTSAQIVQLEFNPAGLAAGTYNATLVMDTSDSLLPVTNFPVSFTILSPLDSWRQMHFGTTANSGNAADNADPDHDGIINILEYAFDTDPNVPSANPISFAIANGHLTVTFKRPHPTPADITYVPEVTDNLASGSWNSGPTFTSQTVTDNGDGTETVVVTDLAPINSTPAHFLRILITQQ
ncbi:MAG TPA: DUF5060 domain-containing protein [Verrucomicrobiae bacterium]